MPSPTDFFLRYDVTFSGTVGDDMRKYHSMCIYTCLYAHVCVCGCLCVFSARANIYHSMCELHVYMHMCVCGCLCVFQQELCELAVVRTTGSQAYRSRHGPAVAAWGHVNMCSRAHLGRSALLINTLDFRSFYIVPSPWTTLQSRLVRKRFWS